MRALAEPTKYASVVSFWVSRALCWCSSHQSCIVFLVTQCHCAIDLPKLKKMVLGPNFLYGSYDYLRNPRRSTLKLNGWCTMSESSCLICLIALACGLCGLSSGFVCAMWCHSHSLAVAGGT